MRDFFIPIQGEEIPVLSYEFEGNTVKRNDIYYDYQNDLTNMIVRKIVENYSRLSKAEIRDVIQAKSNSMHGKLKLNNDEVITFFIAKYLTFKGDPEYYYVYSDIKKKMIDKIRESLNQDKLITLDCSDDLEIDPDYIRASTILRGDMSILRRDIMDAETDEIRMILSQNIKMLIYNYSHMKQIIVDKVKYKLKDNHNYTKNKYRAYSMIPGIVENDLDNYISLTNNISLDELFSKVPVEVIIRASLEYMENKKLNYLLKLLSVANIICHKKDGSKYTKEEQLQALIKQYREIIKEEQSLIERFVLGRNYEEPLDTSYDMKGPRTFEPYYTVDEMDYYGHNEDVREDSNNKKI